MVVGCIMNYVVCIGVNILVNITAFWRKFTLFSAIPLSHFSLKMSRLFCIFRVGKNALYATESVKRPERSNGLDTALYKTIPLLSQCTLFSVKWSSDDSATSFQCSAKQIRSAKLCVFCPFGKLRLSPCNLGRASVLPRPRFSR